VKGDWDVWNARSLSDEPIVRLILDGTVVRVRLDKKATSISLLVALGVRSRRPEGAAGDQEHGR
jgi:putative transposase